MYWLDGEVVRYVPGLQVNLNTRKVFDATTLTSIATDTKARAAALKLIRSKLPPAVLHLKLGFDIKVGTLKFETEDKYSVAAFWKAVQSNQISKIATIPVVMNRCWSYTTHGQVHVADKYPLLLEKYIDQNRAELYRIAGVTRGSP